ncbi:mycoredoxin [Corynebacterium ulcerans]|uniref:Glutaredoxin n=1 Tax=Corynebacterium ulcerans TaxID=65058 RepID=A0ABD7MSZ3_CORUL|nr:mycoredoxin [Corynebacterium ulcerans]MBH5298515.1 mycoredoxin [Corynebacterium ulcerans]QQU25921.1 mycoredoxin [Corynebacterium ulcerans]SNV13638.1 glutaredoxin [Corynebacterium ulcerans]SQG51352.1 glutaredoxin [Corynebacterium ulcerans]SQH02362.1 glutaredoxin [Corynebacterium ulcerans]
MKEHVTIYAADWCPFCQRLIGALKRTNTPFTLVDVETDVQASEWVKSVNNGNRIVPTVKYSDGTTATNPPASDVRRKLEELTA